MSTNTWSSVIFIKSTKPLSDMQAVSGWKEVAEMWTTMGDMDWCVRLKQESSSPEQTEAFVARLREGKWASETRTNMWKQVSSR